MDLKPGDVIAEKYEILRTIGQGGMGAVVAARHRELGHSVALKFVKPEALALPGVRERFEREARAAVMLKSQHVARVFDVGRTNDGVPYLVMEFLEGEDAAQLLSRRGPLPVSEAVDIVLQASDALHEAHGVGIVHRDLKPSNLFLARGAHGEPQVKVLDFGISKVEGVAFGLTHTTQVLGSPLYMSPEQFADARTVDARSDIWSLGATLYELLAGRAPFLADSLPALSRKIAHDPPPPLHELRAEVPRALEDVVLRCLEKNRSARFPSIDQMAGALSSYGRAASTFTWMQAPTPPADAASAPNVTPPSTSRTTDHTTTRDWRRPLYFGGALAIGAAAIGAAFMLQPSSSGTGLAPSPLVPASVTAIPSAVEPDIEPTPLDDSAMASVLPATATPPSASANPKKRPSTDGRTLAPAMSSAPPQGSGPSPSAAASGLQKLQPYE